MGWLLWGVLIGWAACAMYHYSQHNDEKLGNASSIIGMLIFVLAITISVSLGASNGTFKTDPTPTVQGR